MIFYSSLSLFSIQELLTESVLFFFKSNYFWVLELIFASYCTVVAYCMAEVHAPVRALFLKTNIFLNYFMLLPAMLYFILFHYLLDQVVLFNSILIE